RKLTHSQLCLPPLQKPSSRKDRRRGLLDPRRTRRCLLRPRNVIQPAPLPSRRQHLKCLPELRIFLKLCRQLLRHREVLCLLLFHPQPGLLDRDRLANVGLNRRRLRDDLLRTRELHHPRGLHLSQLYQQFLFVFQQRSLEEPQREVLLETLQDHHVLSVQRVGRLPPLALFCHTEPGKQPLHLRNLRLPTPPIRHLHRRTILPHFAPIHYALNKGLNQAVS